MMRALFLALLALVGSALGACRSAAPTTMTLADRESIDQAVDDWNEAWQTGDVDLAVGRYSVDADFTNAFGFYRKGRASIREYLAEVFSLDFVMAGESREVSREYRVLGPSSVAVRSRVERAGQRTAEGQDLGIRETSHLRIFHRRDGEWQLVSHLISDARSIQRSGH